MENQIQTPSTGSGLKSTPRDVFMYLLGTVTLYVSVFSVLSLLFDYVNAAIPDPLNPYYNPADSIRWALAVFIIIFSVFVWVSQTLYRDIATDAGKSEIRIRKWLVHLTLFLAALLIIGDLVYLLYNFLNGDLTISFVLKILSVLVVSTTVFGYYLYDLRRKSQAFSKEARYFVWGVLVAAVLVVVGGFLTAGSPFKQRLVRFDSQRVSDLQNLQSQIVNYWQLKNSLPASQNDLRDSISGFMPPQDPETNAAYEYRSTGPLSFELCATFDLAGDQTNKGYSAPMAYPGGKNDNWNHDAGRVCFSRMIDPQLYGQKIPPVLIVPPPVGKAPPSAGTACPALAKQCPDGSYVSMSGPNCEFAACPTTP